MVLLPLGTQWQEANMHRGPGERAGGSGLAWRSPARTDTLAHSPSGIPGCGSAPGQRRRRAPAATHARRPGRGGRVPPFPRSSPSPPPLRLLSPPPPVARAPAPPSARASVERVPRTRDPGRARDTLTPTRGEPWEEEAEGWQALVAGVPWQWPASPPSPPLRQAGPGRLLPLRPRSPRLPHAPDSALLCSAPGTWLRVGDGGRARPAPAGRVPPWERILGPRTKPPPPESDMRAWYGYPRKWLIVTNSSTHGYF